MACPGCLSDCLPALRAIEQLASTEATIDGVFIKTLVVPDAHTWVPQHEHATAHVTQVVRGAVKVWVGQDYLGIFRAQESVTILAGVMHTFETIEPDTTLLCVHDVSRGTVVITAENALPVEA